jgi:peroxiredoxin
MIQTLALVVLLALMPAPHASAAPDRASDFSLPSLDGQTVHLADLRGRTVLLNFWATWCAPCRVETPWLVDLDQRYRSQGLTIIGVSMDDGSREAVAKFAKEYHVEYPVLIGTPAVADAYGGVRFLPQTFLIGRDGAIISRTFGIRDKASLEGDVRKAIDSRGSAAASR